MRMKQLDIYLAYARVIHTKLLHKIVVIIVYSITCKMNEIKRVKRKNENVEAEKEFPYSIFLIFSYLNYIFLNVYASSFISNNQI